MLRLLVLVLMLANGAYFAWSQGLLRAYGLAPVAPNEPQRVAQQIRPEAVQVLTAQELRQAEAQAQTDSAPKECLQAGPFEPAQAATLRSALESTLPAGAWQLDSRQEQARWIVYMGKYQNAEALTKKRAELANMNLKIEPLNNPALEIGLSLGGFETQALASAELARLSLRGIRTARVVQEREAATVFALRLPAMTEALKARLEGLRPALNGKTFRKCG